MATILQSGASRPAAAPDFYAEPAATGASAFAKDFKGLSCPDVKELGHQFRIIQGDPLAQALEAGRAAGGLIPEIVIDAPNFLPVCFLELGMSQVSAVCKIDANGTDYAGRRGAWSGTGFIVGRNVLLTNHHVLNDIAAAESARCTFNFQLGPKYTPLDTLGFRLEPKKLFVTSPVQGGLDYTFVWIEEGANTKFGRVAMHRSAFTVHPGDYANIVQHANGRLKELVLQGNQVLQDTGLLMHYLSDTEGGSSGSPVFNNRWELIALHHASRHNAEQLTLQPGLPPSAFVNEGIKLSAIAADLERRAQVGDAQALTVLENFEGVDSLMGFFGGLGRKASGGADLERLNAVYSGENEDIDVGFWNIEWLTNRGDEVLSSVAGVFADLNMDIWVLAGASRAAAESIVATLRDKYKLPFAIGVSDTAIAPSALPVIWNTETITGKRQAWPDAVDGWFDVATAQFQDLALESSPGRVFDHTPERFVFTLERRSRTDQPFAFSLVPLSLKALGEGSQRRRMAARIVAAAVKKTIEDEGAMDWIVTGEFNAKVATEEFRERLQKDAAVLGAKDAAAGVFSYLRPPASLVSHIFVSSAVSDTFGADDFLVAARDRTLPEYVTTMSACRPMMVRLSLAEAVSPTGPVPRSLVSALGSRPASPRKRAPKSKPAPAG